MEGYGGFAKALEDPSYMIDLTKQSVKNIHHVGGSILRSSRYSLSIWTHWDRGGFDADKIIEWCLKYDVNQIYVIGGDGTHRGATVLFEELEKRVFLPFPFLFVEPEHRCSWCSQDHW